MRTLQLFLAWPGGGVWPNIAASPIIGGAAWLWGRRRIGRLHQAVAELHAAHEQTHTLVAQLHQAQIGGGPS